MCVAKFRVLIGSVEQLTVFIRVYLSQEKLELERKILLLSVFKLFLEVWMSSARVRFSNQRF